MRPSASKAPRGQVAETGHIPAPVGGINTVDGGTMMPAQDAIYAYNLVAGEHGLRTRLGYREWALNLGSIGTDVRSLLPFTGNAAAGAGDALYAATADGLYNVTSSTATPILEVPFTYNGPRAGYGSSVVFSTPGGRFLVYCDEENGLFIFSEASAAWVVMDVAVRAPWESQTTYFVGNEVANGGNTYVCVTEGVSDATTGPTTTGTGITDGTCVWDYVGIEDTTAIGLSIADQNAGYTLAPESFAFVTAWKSRLWFVEKNSSRAWYLDTNSIYGVATSFDFGGKMRQGGPLRGLYNWSYDGGAGLDTSLVGISDAGDVVIYQGTNPNSVTTFGLKGVWSVGALPAGRSIATEFGGDLLVLSLVGVIPLSRLVVGKPKEEDLYATRKIGNLFNQLSGENRGRWGWALHIHPIDNTLMVLVPTAEGADSVQLVMSMGNGAWTYYRDLPITSACVFEGDLYFGTPDGRVCRNEGNVDNVMLSGEAPTDIQWSVLTAYRNLGTMRHKQVHLIRPIIISGSASPPVECHARYDFNLSEPARPSGSSSTGWDFGTWDSALWGDATTTYDAVGGALGMGREVAIAARGVSNSRTVLVGFDVTFEQGGLL